MNKIISLRFLKNKLKEILDKRYEKECIINQKINHFLDIQKLMIRIFRIKLRNIIKILIKKINNNIYILWEMKFSFKKCN